MEYYDNNINGTLVLCNAMRNAGVKNIIFSSSATVYGDPAFIPITEECPKGQCTNPYGWTKLMNEQILMDAANADKDMSVVLLRYFNPVGAHKSGLIGEDPTGIPNNLMPFISQVAVGKREKLSVFGNDYSTPDGSCIRDFINVVDLAKAHVCALDRMIENPECEPLETYNLGTGNGVSVLELINAFEKVTGVKVPHKIVGRRIGDIEKVWGNPNRANSILGWKAEIGIEETMLTAWNWQLQLRKKGIM
mgnify:CR=1 FL=1